MVPWGPDGDVKVLWMSGRYDYWDAGYSTALQMRTTGASPTTARISTTATSVPANGTFTVSSRRVAGYLGANIPGTRAELWGATGTAAPTLRAAGTGDAAGLVVVPGPAERDDPLRGALAAVRRVERGDDAVGHRDGGPGRTSVRISVDRTAVRRGAPVVIGMRVVNAATNVGIPGVPVQLWQTVGGASWVLRVTATTDATGLATLTRNPTDPVTYQARFPGTSAWPASTSGMVTVSMLN